MPNPTSGASAVARLSLRRLTEVTFVLTTVYADSQGQIISRPDPGAVAVDLAAGRAGTRAYRQVSRVAP